MPDVASQELVMWATFIGLVPIYWLGYKIGTGLVGISDRLPFPYHVSTILMLALALSSLVLAAMFAEIAYEGFPWITTASAVMHRTHGSTPSAGPHSRTATDLPLYVRAMRKRF